MNCWGEERLDTSGAEHELFTGTVMNQPPDEPTSE